MVVDFLRNHHSADLTIPELGKKVVTLMALANADRCADLAALDRDYLKWTPSGVQFTVVQLTKTHTTGPPRIVHYSSLPEDPEACPVVDLRLNIKRSMDLTAQLDFPKPVFVTTRKPFRRASPGMLGCWIKDNLKTVGIDIGQFTAHSTRSASISYTLSKGVPINSILKVANWSSKSTFEKFITGLKAPIISVLELSYKKDKLTEYAMNVPLVSTIRCIWNL